MQKFPLLRSLDPHHQRVGYLSGVLLSAVRGIDSKDALIGRFQDLVFRRIYEDTDEWNFLIAKVAPERRTELQNLAKQSSENDPLRFLMRTKGQGWLFINDFWINSVEVYSSVGALSNEEAKIGRPIDLAKWLELILPTFEISEEGYILATLINRYRNIEGEAFNPLVVRGRVDLQLLYLRAFIKSECLFPVLLGQMVEKEASGQIATRGEHGLLRTAVDVLIEFASRSERPDEILEVKEVHEFDLSLRKSLSTEENYLRPRMEILVDLGIVDRLAKKTTFPWHVTDITSRCAFEWKDIGLNPSRTQEYLDKKFFGSLAYILGIPVQKCTEPRIALKYFANAFKMIGRELGFTPGRTVATLAAINLFMAGQTIEIDELYRIVAEVANQPLGRHLHFSGGSRFDGEFLIRVDEAIMDDLL